MNESKSAVRSKTIITNAAILGLIPIFEAFDIKIDQELLLSLIPLANMLLRMVTSKGINSGS